MGSTLHVFVWSADNLTTFVHCSDYYTGSVKRLSDKCNSNDKQSSNEMQTAWKLENSVIVYVRKIWVISSHRIISGRRMISGHFSTILKKTLKKLYSQISHENEGNNRRP